LAVRHVTATCAAVALAWAGSLSAQETSAPASAEAMPAIDPQAEQVVRRWMEARPDFERLKLEVTDSIERVEDWGQKVFYTHHRTALVERPNHLRIESRGDLRNRDVIYDGQTVVICDLDDNVYGALPFTGTNREMIDMLMDHLGVTIPLADLVREGREHILDGTTSGHWIGQTEVRGQTCDHVAFTRDDLDWQGWFDAEGPPRLRRLVITYKNEPGEPDYVLTLDSMETPDSLPEDAFTFEPPEGAVAIGFLPVVGPATASGEAQTQVPGGPSQ
jgi:hypothetical protein